MSLLTKAERKFIWKTCKFSCHVFIAIISFIISLIIIDFQLLMKAYKWLNSYFKYKKINLNHLQIQKLIGNMSGRQFEIFIYGLLKANRYKVKLTEATADGGKDLIVYDKHYGTIYAELKRYLGTYKVDRPMLQKLIGSAVGDGVNRTWFINTGIYTSEALEYAKKVNMKIWDMDDIMDLICKTQKEKIPFVLAQTFSYKDDNEILNNIKHFVNNAEQY